MTKTLLKIALLTLFLLSITGVSAQIGTLPDPALFLDVDWYHTNLIQAADRWNGGLDGSSGMGVYAPDFSGFFNVNLDQMWQPRRIRFNTAVAHSRAIYMNVEAYRASGEERFLTGAIQGADFLLDHFLDSELGGFYWSVSPTGEVTDDMKQGYANVHPLFALAHTYGITNDQKYLDAAWEQLEVLKEHFIDPRYIGGILPGFNRDFSEVIGVNNVDAFTHYFEALLALYDVTEGDQQGEVGALISVHGNFLTRTLYHDQEGFTDRGYVAYNYDEYWEPSQVPYTRENQWSGGLHATPGHNIELAYLLSRAVERGFDENWLEVADKLIKFCLEYTIDPDTGAMLYDISDYNGRPLPGNPDNAIYIYWPQAETARALLHFTVVRGADYGEQFKAVESFFHEYMTDPVYGGLYHGVVADTLEPFDPNKGDIWKTNYHFNMFFTEVLRLAETYPDELVALNAAQPGANRFEWAFPQVANLLPVRQLGEGFSVIVYETTNGLILRVPKNALAAATHDKQKHALPLLRDQISLKIPFPEYHAPPSDDFPFGVLGYQKIEGMTLTPEDVTPLTQPKIAAQIAHFLYQLHHTTLPDMPNVTPTSASIGQMQTITAPYLRAHLSSPEYERLNRWWEATADFWETHPAPAALIHGDAWYENFVIDTDKNVVGVLDFEGLAIGDLAADFVPQHYISAEFAQAVIAEYVRLGGKVGDHLDERIKRLAGLRELGGLVYGLQTGSIDEDTLGKIRSSVIA